MNQFGTVDVDRTSHELLLKLDTYVKSHFDQLIDQFLIYFEPYCQKIIRMQKEGRKGNICFIHFSILQTNLLAKRHTIRLDAYDENWYLDRAECSGEYDVSEFYQWLDEFADILDETRNNGFSLVTLLDVQRAVLKESNKYLLFIAEVVRVGMRKAIETESYRKMKRGEPFIVCIGGFQDKVDILYKEDRTVKDADEVKRNFEAKRQTTYTHEFCENLNLSGGNFEALKFMFSSFAGSDFSRSSWKKSMILFSNFRETVLKDTNFEETQIFDTDFGGAVLENVSFRGAKLKHSSFAGAKLINVTFEHALLAEELTFDQAELINTVIPESR